MSLNAGWPRFDAHPCLQLLSQAERKIYLRPSSRVAMIDQIYQDLPYLPYIRICHSIYLPYIYYIFTISAIYLPYLPSGKTELLISSKKKLIKQWLISDSIISFHNFHWTQVSQGSFLWVLMSNSTRNFTDVTLAGDDYQLNTSSKEETTIKVSCIFMVFGHPDQESPPKKYFTSRMSSW